MARGNLLKRYKRLYQSHWYGHIFGKLCTSTLIVGLVVVSSCKKSPTDSGEDTGFGKRNYVWSIDTIAPQNSMQTAMTGIYGTSKSNVYVVGWNERYFGSMFRYDGSRWNIVPLTAQEGGTVTGNPQLYAIQGTGPNDIWAVGEDEYLDPVTGLIVDSSAAIHFNGVQWTRMVIPNRGTSLYGIWCLSPTQVWTSSSTGDIFRYDGAGWTKYSLGPIFFVGSIAALSTQEVYAVAQIHDTQLPVDSTGYYLFRFDGNTWTKIDSTMRIPGAAAGHVGAGLYAFGGVLYTISPDIYEHTGSEWNLLLSAQVGHMFQNAPNNAFAIGQSIYQFNGQDWEQLPGAMTLGGWPWLGVYAGAGEVFVVSNDNSKTYILHGR
jgi:hypothetical protein